MAADSYRWTVQTALEPTVVRTLLEPYRPFRIEVNFSNGFTTEAFGDDSAYATREPLAKLHYFDSAIEPEGCSILDVGCHLGYYGHYFLERGARRYVGVEYNPRLRDGAQLIAALAGLDRTRIGFEQLDFAAPDSPQRVHGLGEFDAVLSLASINNMLSLTLALDNLAQTVGVDGILILEYLALDQSEAVCEFRPDGLGPDSTLYWVPSAALVTGYLAKRGLKHERDLLRWSNEKVLEPGQIKIMSVFRRQST